MDVTQDLHKVWRKVWDTHQIKVWDTHQIDKQARAHLR
jgi:hypothetical protein